MAHGNLTPNPLQQSLAKPNELSLIGRTFLRKKLAPTQ